MGFPAPWQATQRVSSSGRTNFLKPRRLQLQIAVLRLFIGCSGLDPLLDRFDFGVGELQLEGRRRHRTAAYLLVQRALFGRPLNHHRPLMAALQC